MNAEPIEPRTDSRDPRQLALLDPAPSPGAAPAAAETALRYDPNDPRTMTRDQVDAGYLQFRTAYAQTAQDYLGAIADAFGLTQRLASAQREITTLKNRLAKQREAVHA